MHLACQQVSLDSSSALACAYIQSKQEYDSTAPGSPDTKLDDQVRPWFLQLADSAGLFFSFKFRNVICRLLEKPCSYEVSKMITDTLANLRVVFDGTCHVPKKIWRFFGTKDYKGFARDRINGAAD
jgi:hypothetical protein